jgi:hypothetical protein
MRILLFVALYLLPISAVALTSYRVVMRRAQIMRRQRGEGWLGRPPIT